MDENTFNIDDNILLTRVVCQQDRRALAILYLKYSPQVESYIASYVSSVDDTEDLLHEVFLQLCLSKGHYDSSKGVKPYILGIARNMIREYNREKEKSMKTIPSDSLNGLSSKHCIREITGHTERKSAQQFKSVMKAIRTRLSPKAREAVLLRFVEGLSMNAAAQKAGCSIGAFYTRLERALKTLRRICRQEE